MEYACFIRHFHVSEWCGTKKGRPEFVLLLSVLVIGQYMHSMCLLARKLSAADPGCALPEATLAGVHT